MSAPWIPEPLDDGADEEYREQAGFHLPPRGSMPEDPSDSYWPEENQIYSWACPSCGVLRSECGFCARCTQLAEQLPPGDE